ncbi:MAG: hypothetical protein K1X72_26510 [Pyrinomonadaceae bacterium]|nr:hypothetical protein [Pyrinomonadaceae bacterium]
MKRKLNRTVLILMNEKTVKKADSIRNWLRQSRFRTSEVENVFQVIEEIEDFTTFFRPQIVLLQVNSFIEDFPIISDLTKSFLNEEEVFIMALSGSDKIVNHKDCFEGNLSELKVKLNEVMPKETCIGLVA